MCVLMFVCDVEVDGLLFFVVASLLRFAVCLLAQLLRFMAQEIIALFLVYLFCWRFVTFVVCLATNAFLGYLQPWNDK